MQFACPVMGQASDAPHQAGRCTPELTHNDSNLAGYGCTR